MRQLQKRQKVALALGGGGFKAQATFAGLIPALLNAKNSDTKDLMSAWALKEHVKVIICNYILIIKTC